jgi:choline-sulfatase
MRSEAVMQKDILLYMSDQHSFRMQGYAGNGVVRTPSLDRIAAAGTSFSRAYTACPLCVPARASMISGLLPSNNGVLFNFNSINSDQATFLHSLTAGGYETVLCGRMHFVGPDQRHGYAERIAGDITPVFHNFLPGKTQTGKPKITGFDENSSLYYIGSGDSPVLAYDRYVVEHAVSWLGQDHDRPFFLTVGTFGPHFPYVAPQELYDYYYPRVGLDDVSDDYPDHPVFAGKMCETDPDTARAARAAYYGLVEQQDRHIGTVFESFQKYLERTGHEGIFIYVSDHGDMNGSRGFYGKQVFYDPSSRIPFLIQGSGIPENFHIDTPVSLLDAGKTICALAGTQILEGDGKNLTPLLDKQIQEPDRIVIGEQYTYLSDGRTSLGRMAVWKNWKYFGYSGFPDDDVLYDIDKDPDERENRIADCPEIADRLKNETEKYKTYEEVMIHEKWLMKQLRVLMKCDYDNTAERWVCPPELPVLKNPIKRKTPFTPTPWVSVLRSKLEEK